MKVVWMRNASRQLEEILCYFIDKNSVNVVAVWDCRREPAKLRRSVLGKI